MDDGLLIARDVVRGPVTWDEFIDLDDDDRRELIDGELIEVDMPGWAHEWIVGRLLAALINWADSRRAGAVIPSGYKVRITNKRGLMPNVQFFRRGNPVLAAVKDKNAKGVVEGMPDLAVEIISPSSGKYDRVVKPEWYADIGVPEYWLIDPEKHTFVRYLLREGKYAIVDSLKGDATFSPNTFPGLVVDLSELWRGPDFGDDEA